MWQRGKRRNSPCGLRQLRFLFRLAAFFPAASKRNFYGQSRFDLAQMVLLVRFVRVSNRLLTAYARESYKARSGIRAVVLAVPLQTLPRWRGLQRIKKRSCLSPRGEFLRFPLQSSPFWEPAQRATAVGTPSFAYFSWRDKKSERPPGRPRHVHQRTSEIASPDSASSTTPGFASNTFNC
jgi:hypothetical protein